MREIARGNEYDQASCARPGPFRRINDLAHRVEHTIIAAIPTRTLKSPSVVPRIQTVIRPPFPRGRASIGSIAQFIIFKRPIVLGLTLSP
jgi:hypothetical protein